MNFDDSQVVITSINIDGHLLLIGSHEKEKVGTMICDVICQGFTFRFWFQFHFSRIQGLVIV